MGVEIVTSPPPPTNCFGVVSVLLTLRKKYVYQKKKYPDHSVHENAGPRFETLVTSKIPDSPATQQSCCRRTQRRGHWRRESVLNSDKTSYPLLNFLSHLSQPRIITLSNRRFICLLYCCGIFLVETLVGSSRQNDFTIPVHAPVLFAHRT